MPGVVSIYQMGDISCPGISDIDLIVVVDPAFAPFGDDISGLSVMQNDEYGYLFVHPPIHVDRTIMAQAHRLLYVSNLHNLWGEDIDILALDREEKKTIEMIKLMEVLIFGMPRSFVPILRAPVFDVRLGLLRVNAVCHTLRLWDSLGGEPRSAWNGYPEEVAYLRQNWFGLGTDRCHQLWELLRQGHRIAMDLATCVASHIRDVWQVTAAENAFAIYSDRFYPTLFFSSCHGQNRLHDTACNPRFEQLPLELSVLLKYYAKAEGRISHHIRCRFRDWAVGDLLPGPMRVMTQRARLINDHCELILAGRLRHTLHFWNGFGFRYRLGWMDKLKGCIRSPLTWLEESIVRHSLACLLERVQH